MRPIDADALMKVLDIAEECEECKYTDGIFCRRHDHFSFACEAITDAPTIDAVEVVRCKDCKFWEEYEQDKEFGHCGIMLCYTKRIHYCSCGEKNSINKEEE